MHLHETEVPVMLEGATVPVGYRVTTKDFDFTAIYETDGTINVYVEWGDDQPGDMTNFPSMSDARGMLETLLGATKPQQPVRTPTLKPDMAKIISESAVEGLKKVGLPDTPKNRLDVLSDMHKSISEAGIGLHTMREVKQAIEDAIIELQDSLL